MNMWSVTGSPVSAGWLNPEPARILYEFDGPRIFICTDHADHSYLAYQCAEDSEAMRFVVVPSNADLEAQLQSGRISVRDALAQPNGWIVDLDKNWRTVRAWSVEIADLPADVLPRPGTLLWAHLTPDPAAPIR
jgi:hypothetical protein